MQLLKWTTAFVTGGSRGIGRGIVLKLAESGVKRIAINYLSNDDAANDTVKKTKDRGAEVILIKGDVGKPEEVKRMFAKVKGDFDGSLDIFVHSARPNPGEWLAPPMEATPEGLRQAFNSAAVAMAVACQECVPLMVKGGRIVGITYALGSRTGSWQVWIAMGGAKAAMESTLRYFAVALAKKGITVNAVSPNMVDDSVINALPEPVYKGIKAWNESGWTPFGGMGTPADIAGAVALLCADEASFITGQTIYVDGGASLMNSDMPLDIQGVG
jgi:NAD(P)-dependent dehydrogenase (short-subunit alcohol dehydrogenase family)